jgi:hypothetical protein
MSHDDLENVVTCRAHNLLPSTYYVVPLTPENDERFLRCAYFRTNWGNPVGSQELFFSHAPNGNFIRLIRPSDEAIKNGLRDVWKVDHDRKLFAAVAQTRTGTELLPNVFHAHDGSQSIIIPALYGRERSLVLIFTKTINGYADLLATSDPIIKPDPSAPATPAGGT